MNQVRRPIVLSLGRTKGIALGAIWATILIVLLLLFQAGDAQTLAGPTDESPKIDAKTRAEMIDSISAALNEVYVFPDVAAKMAEYMRKRNKEKAYDDLTTTRQFTTQLTEDLREISKDGHLWVGFVPD